MQHTHPPTHRQTCSACGYDLAGLDIGATCPECGGRGRETPETTAQASAWLAIKLAVLSIVFWSVAWVIGLGGPLLSLAFGLLAIGKGWDAAGRAQDRRTYRLAILGAWLGALGIVGMLVIVVLVVWLIGYILNTTG